MYIENIWKSCENDSMEMWNEACSDLKQDVFNDILSIGICPSLSPPKVQHDKVNIHVAVEKTRHDVWGLFR